MEKSDASEVWGDGGREREMTYAVSLPPGSAMRQPGRSRVRHGPC